MKPGILFNPRLLLPYIKAKQNARSGDHSFAYYPKKIYLVINNVCNTKCIMCESYVTETMSERHIAKFA